MARAGPWHAGIEHMRQYKYSPFTWGKPGKGRAANAGGASKAVVEGRDD